MGALLCTQSLTAGKLPSLLQKTFQASSVLQGLFLISLLVKPLSKSATSCCLSALLLSAILQGPLRPLSSCSSRSLTTSLSVDSEPISVHLYVCICGYVYTCTHAHMHGCMWTVHQVHICMYVCITMYARVPMHICMDACGESIKCTFVCMYYVCYVCMHVCVCVPMHICMDAYGGQWTMGIIPQCNLPFFYLL